MQDSKLRNMAFNWAEVGVVELMYILLLIFWIIYLYFVKDYGYWEEREVAYIPAVFPFGSLWASVLGTRYWGTLFQKVYEDFKDERYIGFTNVRKPCLLVRDPDLIQSIMDKDFDHFTDHTWIDVNPNDYMMKHLFNMKGQEWRGMRNKLMPAYAAQKVKMMFSLVKHNSDVLRQVLEKKTEESCIVDIKEILYRFSMDVFAACAFGLDINSLNNQDSEFYRICRRPFILNFKSYLKMYIYSAFPVFTKLHCFDFLDQKMSEFLTGVIRSTVETREVFNVQRCDFLDLMIKLKQNQNILEDEGERKEHANKKNRNCPFSRPGKKEGLTIEDITAQTFLFFSAGYETTSNTSLFCLYELACNWEIQDKLYSEVKDSMDRHGTTISYQALEEMTYMEQVINETMRRYPVLPQLVRNCTRPYKLPGSNLEIEKDLKIFVPVYALHHDPKYFPDPYTFNPDRFSPKNCKSRHPCVFLPFGIGPRMCIGFRFGMMKVKAAVASIISDYHISLTPGSQVPLRFKGNSFTTLPSRHLKLVLSRRHPKEL